MQKYNNVDLVLVSAKLTEDSIFSVYNDYFKNNLLSGFDNICLITPENPSIDVIGLGVSKVILDNEIFDFDLTSTIRKEFFDASVTPRRVGWYAQQFIKLFYSYFANSKYFITWDLDTIPLRKIPFFENGRPIINCGRIWRDSSFDLGVQRLLGKGRSSRSTYIAEYMVFKAEFVKSLLNRFGSTQMSVVKNIFSQSMNDFKKDCFSEFEIYGTYLELTGLMAEYDMKKIKSYRNAMNIAPWRPLDGKLTLLKNSGYYYTSVEQIHKIQSYRLKNIATSLLCEIVSI